MNLTSTVRRAALAAFLAGTLAAGFALPSMAGTPQGESQAASTQQLNLTELENRVRETRAISVFQKLALQQQVDELLTRIRHAHVGGQAELTALRRPYDRLLTNIQALLRQDSQLANEVSASREAIWEVLADRAKFASL